MKLRISTKKIIVLALIAYFIGLGIVFLTCINVFLSSWDWRQLTILASYTLISLIIFIVTSINYYYEIDKNTLIVKRLGKDIVYDLDHVVYIHKEISLKKKTVTFVLNNGDIRYLTFDKQSKLYDYMLKNCKNLLTDSEFVTRYPNIFF